jgi:ABC-2 type transport system permease protein
MKSRALIVACHEYVTNVRRKEFILLTLGLPVIMLFFGGISVLATTAAAGAFEQRRIQTIGLVDPGGALNMRAVESVPSELVVRPYRNENAGQADVRAGRIRALVVLDRSYLDTGKVTIYRKSVSLINKDDQLPLRPLLTRGLLAYAGTAPRIVQRVVEPTGRDGAKVLILGKSGQFEPQSVGREAARFAVPYLFTILLTTSIFFAASYLLRGISDEKENRVIEVILSSITAEDLLKGKLIGLAGVGLTQVGIWILLAAIPAMIQFSAYIHLPALALLGAVLFFLLGFGLYATIMAGLGALGTSFRESQQIASAVSFGAFFPFVLIPVLLETPNGTLARILSYIPFTSSTTMVLRLTSTDVPVVDVIGAVAAILITIWLVLKLSAKLFRFGLLIYGKRPSFRETWRWMRQA